MKNAGGILGIIAGIFGVIAAIVTLFFGGLGSAVGSQGAGTVVGLGWGGVVFSFLAIVFGAVVFAKPKGAGIALVVTSILGAVLGGTLVAICMTLSLVGGILAILGAKGNPPSTVVSSETAQPGPKKKTGLWIGIVAGVLGLVVIAGMVGKSSGDKGTTVDPLAELASAAPSNLQPTGELSEIFSLGSKNTDLQRENKLKEITGQIVEWQLPVYEVAKKGDVYRVQTGASVNIGQGRPGSVGTFVDVTPRTDADRKVIEALKTGDVISFKGRIAGSSFRSLEIKPALLYSGAPVAQAAVTAPELAAALPAPENTAAAPELTLVPSFDCSKAATSVEKSICNEPVIGKFDGALAQNYKAMLAANIGDGAKGDLRQKQKQWLTERNRCESHECLVTAYRARIGEVCEYPVISGVHPICIDAADIK
ncbi:MAG: hypothetical protein Q8L87_20230 [Anaerolineales bacterium]|nr:hypothetical protein [Anaerolineales bacterium]